MSVKKKIFVFIVVAITLVALAFWLLMRADQYQLFGEMVYRIETNKKVIALTFDDGPSPDRTEEILRILDQEDVRATFFLVGKALKKHPKEGRLIIDAGHEIGNHSLTHSRMVFIPYSEVARELETTDKIIRD